MRRQFLLSASQQIRRLDRSRTRNDWPVRWAALTDGALMPLVARFEVALPEGLNRGQAGQTDTPRGVWNLTAARHFTQKPSAGLHKMRWGAEH